jgi:hypothetical protein
MNTADRPLCWWCEKAIPMRQRRRGSPKRFCCLAHRLAYGTASRRLVDDYLERGLISLAEVKRFSEARSLCKTLRVVPE